MEPIIFAGTPQNAALTLRELVAGGQAVALVLTREDAPVGRKRLMTESPVAEAATQLGIPVLKTNSISAEDEEAIANSGARLALVVAFGAILKQSTIDLMELGWFNLHYSVLPRWRGASPVQSAILAGDHTTGVTLFKIDRGLDTGEIVGVAETVIEDGENGGRLLARLSQLGVSLAQQELPGLLAGFKRGSPQIGEPTFAPKFDRADARITADDSAKLALAKVHAFNPEPMAWVDLNGQPMRILSAAPIAAKSQPGAVSLIEKRVLLGLGDGRSVELLEVQPAGKNPMAAMDWFRGSKETERTIL
jgi:methionyl-tRNA formyltransferase